jgi:hypothetical protein
MFFKSITLSNKHYTLFRLRMGYKTLPVYSNAYYNIQKKEIEILKFEPQILYPTNAVD